MLFFSIFLYGGEVKKLAIILNVPNHDPTYDDVAIESEVVDGEISSYKVNGEEVDFEKIDELNQKLESDIEIKNRSYLLKEEIMATQISSILEEKGIPYKIMGSRIVVNSDDLSGDDIAELTAHYFFVEDIIEEVEAESEYEDVPETLRLTGVDPSLLWDNTPFRVWGQSQQNQQIGVMLWEVSGSQYEVACPDTNYGSLDSSRMNTYNDAQDINLSYHANIVGHIIHASSEKAHIHCMELGDYDTKTINDAEPKIWISNHSYGYSGNSDYTSNDNELDKLVYKQRVASFKSSGNRGSSGNLDITSPGKGYNVITVSNYDITNNNFSKLVYNNPETGVEKPEIIAQGHFTFPRIQKNGNWVTQDSGSSLASPFVASGFGVNLLSQYPLFRGRPELLKAFLLSTSENITGEKGILNPQEGAGSPRYNYINTFYRTSWVGSVKNYFSKDGSVKTVRRYMRKGMRERVAIAWLVEPEYANKNKALNLDFSLTIKYGGKEVANLVKTDSDKNPFEIAEFTPTKSGYYTIEVKREFYKNTGKLYFGLSSNEMKY
jgi:hypothetical protein